MKLFVSLLLFLFSFAKFSYCQQNTGNINDNQVRNTLRLYENYMGPQAALYNGAEYVPFLFLKDGTPFYDSDTLKKGWISYEHFLYKNIPIQYDVSRDQVIILNFDAKSRLFLENSVIDSFHYGGHTFISLQRNVSETLNTGGFYEVLYSGDVSALALRKKNYRETIRDNQVVRVFFDTDKFFIKRNGKYFEVANQKDVLRVLGDKRNDLKRHMREQKVKFGRKNFEEAFLQTVKIYDQLT
jgi:hypothetical protein